MGGTTRAQAHSGESLSIGRLLENVPAPRDLLGGALRSLVLRSNRRILALDDDPTGTQTVYDVPLILRWTENDISWALRQPSPLSVVVTNSRGLTAEKAAHVVAEVSSNAAAAACGLGLEVSLMSRGDSTLRGHAPLEIDALMDSWQQTFHENIDAVLLCPAYVEAGRITVNGVHYVLINGLATPVGESEFARDATFGFHASRLTEWMAEKAPGSFDFSRTVSITLEDIRRGGVDRVLEKLMPVAQRQLVVIDAAAPSDLDYVAAAVVRAESMGKRFGCQCGPSFLRARAGLPARGRLSLEEIFQEDTTQNAHGLIVVGSHVDLTNEQLKYARRLGGVSDVDVDVTSLIDPMKSQGEIVRSVNAAVESLKERDVILTTSRTVLKGTSASESLEISRAVSSAVVKIVREIVNSGPPLRFLVTKGGITSCDILREAVGFSRGWVAGQLLDGMVSAWISTSSQMLADSSKDEQRCPLVVFAGNVGGPNGLADVLQALRK